MAGKKYRQPQSPESCPVCGEEVPTGALACPECGADDHSGWGEDADSYNALDLPDKELNYDDFVREEFGSAAKPGGIKHVWWITAIVLILSLLAFYIFSMR